jgi:curved DNA-binding protein CbpA
MSEPSEVLGLGANASEAEIRRRYLELVRQFPPDRSPQQFAEIRRAYDQLRDPVARLQQTLFYFRFTETLEPVVSDVKRRLRRTRIPTQTLLSLTGQG